MRKLAFAAALCLLAYPVMAKDKACTLDTAIGRVGSDVLQRNARSSEAIIPILNEMEKITQSAKGQSQDRPLRDFLSPKDAERFSVLRERMIPLNLSKMIESARWRDAQVVRAMVGTAWDAYGSGASYNPALDRFGRCSATEKQKQQCRLVYENQPGDAIYAMRMLFPEPDTFSETQNPIPCTVEYALSQQQEHALSMANSLLKIMKQRDEPAFNQLKAKYGVDQKGAIGTDHMTVTDKQVWQAISKDGNALHLAAQLVFDISNAATFWEASKLEYQSDLEDLQTAGASPNAWGRSLREKLQKADHKTKVAVGFWKMIDKWVPSEESKNVQAIIEIKRESCDKMPPDKRQACMQ